MRGMRTSDGDYVGELAMDGCCGILCTFLFVHCPVLVGGNRVV